MWKIPHRRHLQPHVLERAGDDPPDREVRNHLRFEGITNQGACSVLVRSSTSS